MAARKGKIDDAEFESTPWVPATDLGEAAPAGDASEDEAAAVLADAPDGAGVAALSKLIDDRIHAQEKAEAEWNFEDGSITAEGLDKSMSKILGRDLPEIPDNDDDLLGSGELAVHASSPVYDADGLLQDVYPVDVRREDFHVLKVLKTEWPVGLRLGTMARDEIRAVTGELGEDEHGLIAWFRRLPGDVLFRDGSRVIYRDDPDDGYVVDVK